MTTLQRVLAGFLVCAACALYGAAAADEQAAMTAVAETADANPAPASATPCEDQEKFREFDFWIGEWDVHTADGKLAGRNVIEPSQGGCVLFENWTGASGNTGFSMNYLDRSTDEWVQVWTDAGGSQITIRGGLTDDGMLLTGQIHYVSNGTTAPFRGLWTMQPDGRLRQFFEQSNDGGKTWQPWFEGFYSRVPTASPASNSE